MADRYAGERYAPAVPTCGKSALALHFNGKTIRATGAKAVIAYSAVSGRPSEGKFDYSAERQKIRDQGPIPEGEYWIQLHELQENSWYRLRNPRPAWGDFWITIHPYPATETHGRGGFFIHGGTAPGSAGCIDLVTGMSAFVAALASELEGKSRCYIPLTVRYGP